MIDQPRHDDACHRSHAAIFAALIPNMSRSITLIRTTVLEMRIAVGVHLRRSVSRSDRQATERGLQRFEEMLTQVTPGGDREVGIIRKVLHPCHGRYLAMEKISHEKRLREPNAPESFSASNGFGCFHRLFNAYFTLTP